MQTQSPCDLASKVADLIDDHGLMGVLEAIIDRESLHSTIGNLIEICHQKADHLESYWQDSQTAKLWAKNAKELDSLEIDN
jgi:hypothetical protein